MSMKIKFIGELKKENGKYVVHNDIIDPYSQIPHHLPIGNCDESKLIIGKVSFEIDLENDNYFATNIKPLK